MGKENRETMMKQQPDKLFQEKLANFEKPGPANAWSRIEAGLDGTKKSYFPYLRVAAAVLVIAIGTYVVIVNTADSPPAIAQVTKENERPVPQSSMNDNLRSSDSPAVDSLSYEEKTAFDDDDKPTINTRAGKDKTRRQETSSETPAIQNAKPKEEDILLLSETLKSEDPLPTAEEEPVETSPEQPPSTNSANDIAAKMPSAEARESITLVLTVNDTDAYLEKKPEDGATSGSEKTSTLKRVLQKASELKNNDQDPFGDLRQMKNEILALNFKSEKQRGQKQVNQ